MVTLTVAMMAWKGNEIMTLDFSSETLQQFPTLAKVQLSPVFLDPYTNLSPSADPGLILVHFEPCLCKIH